MLSGSHMQDMHSSCIRQQGSPPSLSVMTPSPNAVSNVEHLHQSSRSLHEKSSLPFALDETPTPTRYIRHHYRGEEQEDLFEEVQNLNPFEEQFRKASQAHTHPLSLELTTPHIIGISHQKNNQSSNVIYSTNDCQPADDSSLDTPRIVQPPALVDSDHTISSTSRDDYQLGSTQHEYLIHGRKYYQDKQQVVDLSDESSNAGNHSLIDGLRESSCCSQRVSSSLISIHRPQIFRSLSELSARISRHDADESQRSSVLSQEEDFNAEGNSEPEVLVCDSPKFLEDPLDRGVNQCRLRKYSYSGVSASTGGSNAITASSDFSEDSGLYIVQSPASVETVSSRGEDNLGHNARSDPVWVRGDKYSGNSEYFSSDQDSVRLVDNEAESSNTNVCIGNISSQHSKNAVDIDSALTSRRTCSGSSCASTSSRCLSAVQGRGLLRRSSGGALSRPGLCHKKLSINVTSAAEAKSSGNIISTPTPVITIVPSVTQCIKETTSSVQNINENREKGGCEIDLSNGHCRMSGENLASVSGQTLNVPSETEDLTHCAHNYSTAENCLRRHSKPVLSKGSEILQNLTTHDEHVLTGTDQAANKFLSQAVNVNGSSRSSKAVFVEEIQTGGCIEMEHSPSRSSSHPSATVLQLMIRLPNGESLPVEIPTTPVLQQSGFWNSVPLAGNSSATPSGTSVVSATGSSNVLQTCSNSLPVASSNLVSISDTNVSQTSNHHVLMPGSHSSPLLVNGNTTIPVESNVIQQPSLAKIRLKEALRSGHHPARQRPAPPSRAHTAQRIAVMTTQRTTPPQQLAGTGSLISNSSQQEQSDLPSVISHSGLALSHRGKKRPHDVEDPSEKRIKFLERNRAAAVRCREKKKEWVQRLASKSSELASVNVRLQAEIAALRSEVAGLKTLLLQHRSCSVTLAALAAQKATEAVADLSLVDLSVGAKSDLLESVTCSDSSSSTSEQSDSATDQKITSTHHLPVSSLANPPCSRQRARSLSLPTLQNRSMDDFDATQPQPIVRRTEQSVIAPFDAPVKSCANSGAAVMVSYALPSVVSSPVAIPSSALQGAVLPSSISAQPSPSYVTVHTLAQQNLDQPVLASALLPAASASAVVSRGLLQSFVPVPQHSMLATFPPPTAVFQISPPSSGGTSIMSPKLVVCNTSTVTTTAYQPPPIAPAPPSMTQKRDDYVGATLASVSKETFTLTSLASSIQFVQSSLTSSSKMLATLDSPADSLREIAVSAAAAVAAGVNLFAVPQSLNVAAKIAQQSPKTVFLNTSLITACPSQIVMPPAPSLATLAPSFIQQKPLQQVITIPSIGSTSKQQLRLQTVLTLPQLSRDPLLDDVPSTAAIIEDIAQIEEESALRLSEHALSVCNEEPNSLLPCSLLSSVASSVVVDSANSVNVAVQSALSDPSSNYHMTYSDTQDEMLIKGGSTSSESCSKSSLTSVSVYDSSSVIHSQGTDPTSSVSAVVPTDTTLKENLKDNTISVNNILVCSSTC